MIPLFHDFADETVLVVGGGPVGARKARKFAREADVLVLSPDFADADFGDAERVQTMPAPEDAADWVARTNPALVVAATDDGDVNDAFVAAARDAGALVNRADESGGRDADSVVVPATVRDDPVAVAVATGGASPALSKYLREQLENELAGAGAIAELTADLRTELQAADVDPETRRNAVRAVVRSGPVWKALRTGGTNARQTADDVVADVVGNSEWST
ncbi:precorrin-2 dehydrogenase/sirohydrochlorin ferrochelatase family protein [Halobacterium noricense]|uniref:precorrin-2 dehydrogenase/sirohydrochlorin ferrochelatase family protein n=1 Tax=Halobacterium noricense TaxID=223182 RepID=UPI001E48E986|nr:NAD(P)-dependent oxidoreductase [Halobacterium noricense]UHH24754.1 bifunctional precorrin-2 dehydrogenase/sirohydrochlorin ferrochelatase [Halobacterium noricense]